MSARAVLLTSPTKPHTRSWKWRGDEASAGGVACDGVGSNAAERGVPSVSGPQDRTWLPAIERPDEPRLSASCPARTGSGPGRDAEKASGLKRLTAMRSVGSRPSKLAAVATANAGGLSGCAPAGGGDPSGGIPLPRRYRLRIQCLKWRLPVTTIVAPAARTASSTSGSRREPPGWMMARTPASSASFGPSAKGKNASEARTAPSSE